jgi:5-methylcytosine-specific restriction endonuclease McrA
MVFVLDSTRQPLDPCHPARARELLRKGRAAVFRRYPFTIILKDHQGGHRTTHRLKLDPGSKTTGIAIVQEATGRVVWAGELTHRGQGIRDALLARKAARRLRRQRHTRYRKARFLNRTRPEGWLAPSLQHRVLTTLTWAKRLERLCPITAISMELVRFDTQLIQDAEVSGVAYQQGELQGYEVREYLLEKWGRRCAYCQAKDVPLQVEHLVPKTRGGSNRVSNLTLACGPCNQKKGQQTAVEFGHPHVMAQAKQPLTDAAAVNSVRWALWQGLQAFGLPLEVGTGGRTKWNRTRLGLAKTHWADAACVGASTPNQLQARPGNVLLIAAKGHGSRQMCRTDKYGFPIRHVPRQKQWFGFRTGDLVKGVVPNGKYAGTHVGRVTIRSRPAFRLNGIDIHPKYLRRVGHADGYAYATRTLERTAPILGADAVHTAVRNSPLRYACSPARLKAAVPWEVFDGGSTFGQSYTSEIEVHHEISLRPVKSSHYDGQAGHCGYAYYG